MIYLFLLLLTCAVFLVQYLLFKNLRKRIAQKQAMKKQMAPTMSPYLQYVLKNRSFKLGKIYPQGRPFNFLGL